MWAYALLLACGSSTDNFVVGVTVGISGRPLQFATNAIISVANTAGTAASAACGRALGEAAAPSCAALLASCVFAYLASVEFWSWTKGGGGGAATSMGQQKPGEVLRLALPMTLNNLAGGAAGGAVGVGPVTAGVMALTCSYLMMKGGHVLGLACGKTVSRRVDSEVISGAIFGVLALVQLWDGLQKWSW